MNPLRILLFLATILIASPVSAQEPAFGITWGASHGNAQQSLPEDTLPVPATEIDPAIPATGRKYSLEEAVQHGLEANPTVASRQLLLESAQWNTYAYTSDFLPRVSISYTGMRLQNNSNDFRTVDDLSQDRDSFVLSISQTLFAGFSILNSYEQAAVQEQIEQAQLEQSRLDLIFSIQQAFLRLLRAREDLKTIEASRKRIEKQLEAAQAFVRLGMAPYLNVLQNEVELAQVRREELMVKNSIRTQEVELNKLLDLEPDYSADYVGSLQDFNSVVPFSEQEALEQALKLRPDLKIAQRSVEEAVRQSHVVAGRFLPTVTVDAAKSRTLNMYDNPEAGRSTVDYWTLSLNAKWEIFSGGRTTFSYLKEKKRAESLKMSYEESISSAKADVIKAFLDIENARKLIAVARSEIKEAEESYDMALTRYKGNVGTITDLLDAQYSLTKAEAELNAAYTQFHLARANIFYQIGIENLNLN